MGFCCINGIFIDSISTSSVSQKVKNEKDRQVVTRDCSGSGSGVPGRKGNQSPLSWVYLYKSPTLVVGQSTPLARIGRRSAFL
jgi:hypothetical protein